MAGLRSGGLGALEAGIVGGIYGGLDALDKGANFWTGEAIIDITGAMDCVNWDVIEEKVESIVGKYVGDFEGQNVYESELLGTYSSGKYSGFTLPNKRICVGKGVYTSCMKNGRAMVQHEFGHVLQHEIVGSEAYYNVIASESLKNCIYDQVFNTSTHSTYWTETWANYLAKEYFGKKWLGVEVLTKQMWYRYYPSRNISTELMKVKFGR